MASHSATFAEFLRRRDRTGRLQLLTEMREAGESLPLSLAEDLLCLDLAEAEKLAILDAAGSRDGRALEHFLTENLLLWPQELAAPAVRLWSLKTEHLLWFRVLSALRYPHVSQRVVYTIVDHAFCAGGRRLITTATTVEGLEEMSPALHGLLLHRAVQWGVEDVRMTALAHDVVKDLGAHLHPDNKALPSAVAYLARFHASDLRDLLPKVHISEPWRDLLRALCAQAENPERQAERVTKLLAKPPKAGFMERLCLQWPPLWQRQSMPAATVAQALTAVLQAEEGSAREPETPVSYAWEFFAGIPDETLTAALAALPTESAFAAGVCRLSGLLPTPASEALLEQLKSRITSATDPGAILSALPLRLRLELTEEKPRDKAKPTAFSLVKAEEAAVLRGDEAPPRTAFRDVEQEDPAALASRKAFFDLAYRGQAPLVKPVAPAAFFGLLVDAWQTPTEAKLGPLAQAARQVDGLMRLCYLNTLGRFRGHDQAALKILDFIRSKEEDDLRAVLHSLGGIATPRAAQELVAALTRPNITAALQIEACTILQRQDLGNLQAELRSALSDLSTKEGDGASGWDVREAIAGLLTPPGAGGLSPAPSEVAASASAGISDQQLDQALAGKIAHYRELSSEVKRALRTSQFFHIQVTGESAPESIDLSPLVDMQYKALELLFREVFEETCSRLINRGVLQRKLDVIGYARPVPRAMDEFEAYVASLPIVRDVPFFSKFKLRKMLRAICQFRPGKRFTLDGLKAFALFFLCFSRSECRYGLQGLFPLGFRTDLELFEFVKALHMHQDVRNRAAHEGFHPDAASDIDGIWRATAEIVQTLFKAKGYADGLTETEFSPKNRSTPIVEKKVS